MIPRRLVPVVLAVALAAGGCAFVPKSNARLEEAHAVQARMLAEREVTALAPAETRRAQEAFESAIEASNTLQDPALVDHLSYVARQRAAIAIEVARRIAAERAIGARLLPVAGSAR